MAGRADSRAAARGEAADDHWTRLLARGVQDNTLVDDLTQDPGWRALTHALREAADRGLNTDRLLLQPSTTTTSSVPPAPSASVPDGEGRNTPAHRLARVLNARMDAVDDSPTPPRDGSVLGLLAYPHLFDDDLKRALNERVTAMREHVDHVLDVALAAGEPWVRELGTPPTDAEALTRWRRHAIAVATHRELYGMTPQQAAAATDAGPTTKGDARHASTHPVPAPTTTPEGIQI